jgi:site-specific recombinase XerC
MRAPSPITVEQAANAWVKATKDGAIDNRSGDPYKPSVVRRYDIALRCRVIPALGGRRLSDVTTLDVQDFADQLKADGLPPSTIRNALMPLRAIYRHHFARGIVAVNPTRGIQLPAVRSKRPQIVTPERASKLIAALPVGQRALWATALYAGLRRGELMGLDWSAWTSLRA